MVRRSMSSRAGSEYPTRTEGAAEFAQYGTDYLVDLPGYGPAPNPRRDVMLQNHANAFARCLEPEDIDCPSLVGPSMGSQVITWPVLNSPETTDRIALLAPTMDPVAPGFWHATGPSLRGIFTREPPAVNAIVSVDYFFRRGILYYLKQTVYLLADRIEDRLSLHALKGLLIRGDRDCICADGSTRRVAGPLRDGGYAEVPGPHVFLFTDQPRIAALVAHLERA